MSELHCDVIRDLLPVYVDGLESDATRQVVDEHLKDCQGCREALNAMRSPEPERAEAEQKELDFLQTARKRGLRSRLIVALAILLLTAAAFCLRTFVIGSKSQTELVYSDANVEDTSLTLRCSPMGSADAIGKMSFSEENGVVTVTTRTVLASPLHQGAAEERYNASAPIRQVIVNDRVVWDEGADISPFAAGLYATRHPYVGSASDNGKTASQLFFGGIQHSLDTEQRPYTWHIELCHTEQERVTGLEDLTEAQAAQLAGKMKSAAYAMLALVENLDQVSFDYLQDGEPASLTVTADEATEFFGRDIKDCYESPRLFAALLQKADLNSTVNLDVNGLDLRDRTITIRNASDAELLGMSLSFQDVNGAVRSSVAGQNADNSALKFGDSLSFNVPGWTMEGEALRLSVTTMAGDTYLIDQPISLAADQTLTLKGSPDAGFTLE